MSEKENNSGDEPVKDEEPEAEKSADETAEENGVKPTTPSKREKSSSPQKTTPVKKPKAEESEDDEEGEEEDEEEEEEEGEVKLGLLDLPLEVSGSRERKKVERLEMTYVTPKEKKGEIGEGTGERLGEFPAIEAQIQKKKTDDLKVFHRVLFNRPGTTVLIKKNIRSFRGFSFSKSSPEFKKKHAALVKLTLANLKDMCSILNLERSGTKEDIVDRILDFLLKPNTETHSGKKRKSKSKGSAKKKSKKDSTTNSNSKSEGSEEDSGGNESDEKEDEISDKDDDDDEEKPKKKEKPKDDNKEDDEDDEDADDKEDEDDDDDDDDDYSEDEKKKKNKRKPAAKSKAAPKKKVEKKPAKKEKPAPKKTAPKKRKAISDDSDDSDEDDEPLAKISKQPPTNDELKNVVKSILDGANLEEITMKTVCKQVYSKYPDFDLSDRKEFIKSTVRSIIS